MVTPQTSSPSASTHDSQEPTPYDESSISLFSLISLSSDRSQATNLPSTSISHHLQVPPSDQSTVQGTAIDTTDHQYTRARFDVPHVGEGRYEVDVHITQRWPDVVGNTPTSHMSTRSTSPEVFSPHSQSSQQVEHRVGPSGLPDNEQASSPMTSSPHVAFNPTITNLIDFAPQPTSSKQRSVKTHSGKRRYRCDVCDSGWGRPSSLKMHMVSHTGVKEFVCPYCKRGFGVKSSCARHIRVLHKDSSEGSQTRAACRGRGGPVRFIDEGLKFPEK